MSIAPFIFAFFFIFRNQFDILAEECMIAIKSKNRPALKTGGETFSLGQKK